MKEQEQLDERHRRLWAYVDEQARGRANAVVMDTVAVRFGWSRRVVRKLREQLLRADYPIGVGPGGIFRIVTAEDRAMAKQYLRAKAMALLSEESAVDKACEEQAKREAAAAAMRPAPRQAELFGVFA